MRRLAVELRPKALDDFGLVAALERLVETFSEATGIPLDLEARLGDERLPTEVETTLYRIVQEALTNVVKHARAGRVSVLLVRRPGSATVVIEDDGEGFAPEDVREDGAGLIRHARARRAARRAADDRVLVRDRDGARRRGAALVAIRILVVDDHAVVRAGLRLLLDAQEDIEVVGEAGNAKDAVFRARELKPDVILLDVVMPGESGIDGSRRC